MARSVCIRSLTALTATILAVLLFAMGTTAQVRDFPNIQLRAPARGSAALSALAAHLPQIAHNHPHHLENEKINQPDKRDAQAEYEDVEWQRLYVLHRS